MNSGYYPMGAYNDPDAPYNEPEMPYDEIFKYTCKEAENLENNFLEWLGTKFDFLAELDDEAFDEKCSEYSHDQGILDEYFEFRKDDPEIIQELYQEQPEPDYD